MTQPTRRPHRLLTGAADDIVERQRLPGPDAPLLWRRLLVHPAGSGPARSVLVDARTGARVASTGGPRPPPSPGTSATRCGRPGSRSSPTAAGSPAPGAVGAWQERVWQSWLAVLPLGGVLVLIGLAWMVVALRRSRRHGEDFLRMILRLPC